MQNIAHRGQSRFIFRSIGKCDHLALLWAVDWITCDYSVDIPLLSQLISTTIRERIVAIRDSQGIRIPKTLLEQSGIESDVEIEVHNHTLTIRSAQQSRLG